MPFTYFLSMVLAMGISAGLLCRNGYVFGVGIGRVPKRTKQLSTVEVAGLVRALAHVGSLTN